MDKDKINEILDTAQNISYLTCRADSCINLVMPDEQEVKAINRYVSRIIYLCYSAKEEAENEQ